MFSKYNAISKGRMNVILKSILNYKRITRNRLSDLLNLSPSSISKYTKTLMDMGLVNETEQEKSTGGRRSAYIELNPAAGLNIALVLSASYMQGVLINTVGEVIDEYSLPTYLGIPKEDLLDLLYRMLDKLFDKAGGFHKKIFGIGIGLGGHIDPKLGISHEYLYAKNWYDVPLKELVESKYKIPCFLINDANACALGEKYYGKGIGVEHFICVMMDEGIGMGIVANGEIYMGQSYYAGEFGHTHAVSDGQLCFCGHTGCLETVSSKQFILSVCREGLGQGVNSEILKYCENDIDRLQIEHVITAANNGDRFARNIFDQMGKEMGNKLSDIVNVLNPELIILRGPVIDGNQFLYESIERVVMNQSLRHIAKSLRILYSEDRNDFRFMGINSMILVEYFTQQ
jgi:predicted NBD/HSP70 family sugar kinase